MPMIHLEAPARRLPPTLMYHFNFAPKHLARASILVLLMLGVCKPAFARSTQDHAYPMEVVWSAAVRFLRVDLRFPVLERDREAGYILFDYVQDTKVHKASVELMAVEEAGGGQRTRVVVSVPDLPRHVEAVLLEKLARKLKEELGAPSPTPSRGESRRRDDKTASTNEGDRDDKNDHGQSTEGTGPKRGPGGARRSDHADEDPNAPVRGDDGLPRLRTLPRPAGP